MNKVLILSLFFISCTSTHKTKLLDKVVVEKDWLHIYEKEIEIAIQNEDRDAHYFFIHEWLREKRRLQASKDFEWKPIPEYAK